MLPVTLLAGGAGWRAPVCLGPTLGFQPRVLILLFVSSRVSSRHVAARHLSVFVVHVPQLLNTVFNAQTYAHTQHTHTHTSHTTSRTAHTTFVLINLHHLLCLSFLPRPASTFVSDYWKKLTCGVLRSFPFVNVNLHMNSLVLGFPIPRKTIWTKSIGKPTRCQPNWRLGNQKSGILWWIVLTVFGFTVFLDQSSQCSDDHCGHLTSDSYTDLYRVLE